MKYWKKKSLPATSKRNKYHRITKTSSKKYKTPWNKVRLQRKKLPSTFHLSNQEWKFLAELLHCGYPLLDALHLLHSDESYIKEQLEAGRELTSILTKGQKGRFHEHLHFFLNIASLADAIDSSLQMLNFEQGLKKKFFHKAAYPIFILFFAYVMLWFFTSFIIPQMLQSFLMEDSFGGLILFIRIIQIVSTLFGIASVLALLLYIALQVQPLARVMLLWKLHPHIPMICDYVSYLFGGYLVELEKKGISTHRAMQYLRHVKEDTLFSRCIEDIMRRLENGEDLLHIIECSTLLNDGFRLSLRVGSSTSNITNLLDAFMKQQENVWEKTLQKASVCIQCIAYGFVGIVVVIVYQIMLVPLSMLENM